MAEGSEIDLFVVRFMIAPAAPEDGAPYDETRYLATLEKRNSLLVTAAYKP